MGIGNAVISILAKRYRVTDAKNFMDSIAHLGRPSEHTVPQELIPMAAREATRGFYNMQFFQSNRDWVFPYWAERQFDPNSSSFIPRMNYIGLNLTHRNWTAIGNLGGVHEPVVDQRGLVSFWDGSWSLDTWLRLGDELICPSRLPEVGQSIDECAPCVITEFKTDQVFVELETFACRIRGVEAVLHQIRTHNLTKESLSPKIYFSIRPYSPEGVCLVHDIRYFDEGYFSINGNLGLVFMENPSRVHCSDVQQGDCSFFTGSTEAKSEIHCKAGMANAFAEFAPVIPAGGVSEFLAVIPIDPASSKSKKAKELRRIDYRDHKTRLKSQWTEKVNEGMTIEIPDEEFEESFYVNKAYLCLLDDGDSICPGPLTYHQYWFRDSAYLVAALDKMGYTDQARQKLLNYPKRQTKDGFFLSQDGEWDSNGQAIWTLFEHYRITQDKDFLKSMFPAIGKGAYWIEKKRKDPKAKSTPHAGLLPPGFSAEHFGPNNYFYWDDLWGIAGLRDAARSAEIFGYRKDLINFEKFHDAFLSDLRTSFKNVENRLGKPLMPTSPYRRMDSAAVGCVAGIYPLQLLNPDEPCVTNTLDYLYEHCFIDGMLFHDMTHAGLNAYLSLHVAQAFMANRDKRALTIAKAVLAKATETFTWPEAIHTQTGGGCMGDGHHGWAVADWLLFVRNMLIMEQEDTLIITPLIPESWLDWGKRVVVREAPTHFGPVTYSIECRQSEIILTIHTYFRNAPRFLRWDLPFVVYEALVDDKAVTVNGDSIQVAGGAAVIRIRRIGQ